MSGYYDDYYMKAQKIRALIKQHYREIFYDADMLLAPVSPRIAPKFHSLNTPLDMYLSDVYTRGFLFIAQ